jgi:Mg-chelatase subunit ChlD
MKGYVRIALLAAASLVMCLPAFPQNPPESRLLLLGVHAPDGRFVRGITADQIRLQGVQASIRQFTFDNQSRRIVLLMDVSGSMQMDSRRWALVLLLLKNFVSKVQQDDWLSLHIFADRQQVLVPPTHDFAEVNRQIESIPTPSKRTRPLVGAVTSLNTVLRRIIEDPTTALASGDAIVLVSDESTVSDKGESQTADLLISRGIRLFFIRVATSPLWVLIMRDIALRTGGAVCVPWNRASDEDAQVAGPDMLALYSLIRCTYRVELQISEPDPDFRRLGISLVNSNGTKAKKLSPLYPRGRSLPR